MRTIYEWLCRYTVRTRVIAIIIVYVIGIFVSLSILGHASETENVGVWVLGSVLTLMAFVFVATEIYISIEEQAWEKEGVYGMYHSASKNRRT